MFQPPSIEIDDVPVVELPQEMKFFQKNFTESVKAFMIQRTRPAL